MKTVQIGKKHTPLIVGNWKMNPQTLQKAEGLIRDLKKKMPKKDTCALVSIAAPFPFIAGLRRLVAKTRIALAAQDVSFEESGAHTGEVSVAMLKSLDVKYIIAGHSERRAQGETDAEVGKNVLWILKNGLTAIACVGEKKRDQHGDYFGTVEAQLSAVLSGVAASSLSRLVIAYEPIWAIGTGKHATPEDVQEMKLFIQKVIADTIGRKAVPKVRILYGGSVTKDNAEELLEKGRADGFLVGGASLSAPEFAGIIQIADHYGRA